MKKSPPPFGSRDGGDGSGATAAVAFPGRQIFVDAGSVNRRKASFQDAAIDLGKVIVCPCYLAPLLSCTPCGRRTLDGFRLPEGKVLG